MPVSIVLENLGRQESGIGIIMLQLSSRLMATISWFYGVKAKRTFKRSEVTRIAHQMCLGHIRVILLSNEIFLKKWLD